MPVCAAIILKDEAPPRGSLDVVVKHLGNVIFGKFVLSSGLSGTAV